jgi:hypothetical protein
MKILVGFATGESSGPLPYSRIVTFGQSSVPRFVNSRHEWTTALEFIILRTSRYVNRLILVPVEAVLAKYRKDSTLHAVVNLTLSKSVKDTRRFARYDYRI